MAHIVGTVQPVSPQVVIGPDSGLPPTSPNTWTFDLDPGPQPAGGIKFIIVHIQNLNLPANNRVEIELGYDKDVVTATSGFDFWSRPVNLSAFANGKVPIRYITNGAATGGVTLDRLGRGERHDGDGDPTSNSNCDPFLLDANYIEPTFNTALFCTGVPQMENIDCVAAAADIRKVVAPAVGMIVHVDLALDGVTEILSSFSATLVGPDLVLTSGQNLALSDAQVKSSSIIFNYQTTCAGARPANYAPRFHRVQRVFRLSFFGVVDYALIQLTVPANGLGIAPITMRPDLPAPGEQIFCIHHPEGAVKRLSAPQASFQTVLTSDVNAVVADLDVASGSTGAGLFDSTGRVVGVLSTGTPCNIAFFPTASVLQDIANNQQGDPLLRDVMIVFDRSGSMALDAGNGRSKIDEARDAASLFVTLVQKDSGNNIGLISFSTAASSPVDFAPAQVNDANNLILIGLPPFSGGKIGALVPVGSTSIGAGLIAARDALASPNNARSILLLTDGLQNTPPLIADVSGLDFIDVNAIGFGAESSLNGALLTQLSETHNGLYMRAGDGLELKKYFSLAFGNIFATGALLDPESQLARGEDTGKPIKFQVCGENAITIVVGWDKAEGKLAITAKTPGGATITATSPGVTHATGRTWSFLRIRLPHGGERNGTWTVTAQRAGTLQRQPALHYFVSVIAGGGVRMTRWAGADRFFTGDAIEPAVRLASREGDFPANASVRLTVKRPNAAAGNILTKEKLRPPVTQSGDTLPARQSTMLALEKAAGKPLIGYTEHKFELASQAKADAKNRGVFAQTLKDFLILEGTYTFHAVASYGKDCIGTRELQWSVQVEPGVDQAKSDVKVAATGTRPDKKKTVTFTIVPRDSFGNHLGPDRQDAFRVSGAPGTTLTGAVRDNGDGSYSVAGIVDDGARKPDVVLTRPPRPERKGDIKPRK